MIRALVLAMAVAAAAPLALAHGTGPEKAHHGGKVVVAGHDHLELVVGDGDVTLYVRDGSDAPESVQGAVGTATVLVGGKRETIALVPQQGNVLKGRGTFVAAPGLKVVVSLTLPGHERLTARFAL
jgi:hypothetical protein